MGVDVAEQTLDEPVVGLDEGPGELIVGELELEIDLGEGAVLYIHLLGIIAEQLAHKHMRSGITGLEREFSVDVGGKAYGRIFEEYARKRYWLAGISIRHGAADLGSLGAERQGGKEHRQYEQRAFH